jgi:hypothetical protein
MSRKEKGYSHRKADAKKVRKRQEAEERQAKYDALSLSDKIALVTNRGGSQKELARLTQPKAKPISRPSLSVEVAAPIEEKTPAKRTRKSEIIRQAKLKRPSKS